MATRGELINSVALKTGLDSTPAVSSEELILMQRWSNDGIVEVLLKTHCYVIEDTIALSANTYGYRLASTTLAITDLQITADTGADYERVSMDEIHDLRRIGSTEHVYGTHGDWFEINPLPSATGSVNILVVKKPTTIWVTDGTAADDTKDASNASYGGIPTQYHRAIEYYMLWQAAEYDEKRLAETPKDYRQQFEDECNLVKRRMQEMGGRRLSRARVGYPSRPGFASRNDVYPIVPR